MRVTVKNIPNNTNVDDDGRSDCFVNPYMHPGEKIQVMPLLNRLKEKYPTKWYRSVNSVGVEFNYHVSWLIFNHKRKRSRK